MTLTKSINGVEIELTAEEITAYNAKQSAWENDSANRKLNYVKDHRQIKLEETDWYSNSDVTMPDNINTWRQLLRDIPQNNTTEAEYDLLLARDADKNLTNSIWEAG